MCSVITRGTPVPSVAIAAAEVPLERLIQPVGKRLYRCLWDALATSALEAVGEIGAAKECTRLLVMSLNHLEHLVVKMAALRQGGKEQTMLFADRIETVFERLVHIPFCTGYKDFAQRPLTESAKASGSLAVFSVGARS